MPEDTFYMSHSLLSVKTKQTQSSTWESNNQSITSDALHLAMHSARLGKSSIHDPRFTFTRKGAAMMKEAGHN